MIQGFTVFIAAVVMIVLGVLMSAILDWASRRFKVEVDPRVEEVEAKLPAANCGGCGYVGCAPYAKAVVNIGEAVTKCTVGGPSVAAALAAVMGVEVEAGFEKRAVIHCGSTFSQRSDVTPYSGEASCSAANLVAGYQGCVYGCLGLGDCAVACEYDAIIVKDGLARINYDNCTGCECCVSVCPKHIISMVPFREEQMLVVTCSNPESGKDVKNVCEVGCTGCKSCAKFDAPIQMNGLLPVIQYDSYSNAQKDGLDQALDKCPVKALFYVGRLGEQYCGDETGMEVFEADYKSTIDETEWRG